MYPQIVHTPLLIHFHQPVGQFGFVYEKAYEKSYFPLISYLFHFPKIKVNLHFSGPVLEWLDANKPEIFTDYLIPMIERKQAEIVTGGYYEPILASIADEDKINQIIKLNNFWNNKIGKLELQGLWLTERVWEPGLVKPLHQADIKWVLIDDENFELNTYTVRSSFYPVITEDQGYTLKILAINEKIRYLIPWKPVQETFNFLKNVRDTTDPRLAFKPFVVIMTDAEKMGLWPADNRSTYDICYGTGFTGKPWIQELFEMIDETPWIKSCTISEYFDEYKAYPLPYAYFKTESYDKMGIWALPSNERRRIEKLKRAIRKKTAPVEMQEINLFLQGSHWRSFLSKYVESNVLHKKMVFMKAIYENIQKNYIDYIDKYDLLDQGYDYILQTQCNDVYWHGQFGGIYYRFIREYSHGCLIKAFTSFERLFKENLKKSLLENITITSVLLNGTPDAIINGSKIMIYIAIADGGTMFSLDDKENAINFSNVFTRLIESYHPPEGRPEEGIVNDLWPRRSFRDYFFSKKPDIKSFFENKIHLDSLFHISPYEVYSILENESSLSLKCTSTFKDRVLGVIKTFKIIGSLKKLIVNYQITNLSDNAINCYFIPEMNFILPGDDKKFVLEINKSGPNEYDQTKFYNFETASSLAIYNSEWQKGFKIGFRPLVHVQMYTLLSHENSESSLFQNYQGHCILPCLELEMSSLGKQEFMIEVQIY